MYNDKFIDKTDGYAHSKWLSFMSKRLEIAKELLSDNGVIFISIDENEYAQLSLLLDNIFNEDNKMSNLHIQVRYSDKSLTEDKPFKPVIEYVCVYAKDIERYEPNRPYEDYTDQKFIYEITELEKGTEFYVGKQKCTVFKEGEWKIEQKQSSSMQLLKETWISGTIYTKMSYGQVFKSVVEPRVDIDGIKCLYKVHGRGNDGLGYRYYTGPQRKNAKRGKMYSGMPINRQQEIDEGTAIRLLPIETLYDYAADFGNIAHEGNMAFNSGKKPIKLVKQLINYHKKNNATILDFFAGSGTTGHAVIKLNQEDGGNRKYILCTNNENNICEEVTYKRLKNIQEELPHNLKYYKTKFIKKFDINDKTVKQQMLEHIIPLIELENHIQVDYVNNIVVIDEEIIIDVIKNSITNANIYVSSNIFLSENIKELAENKNVNLIEIPDYYFKEELREVGEL